MKIFEPNYVLSDSRGEYNEIVFSYNKKWYFGTYTGKRPAKSTISAAMRKMANYPHCYFGKLRVDIFHAGCPGPKEGDPCGYGYYIEIKDKK